MEIHLSIEINYMQYHTFKDQNEAYSRLLKQQEVVRDVINKVVRITIISILSLLLPLSLYIL